MSEAKKLGRPSLVPSERKRLNRTFRVKDSTNARLVAAADANQRSVSEEVEYRLEQSFLVPDIADRVAEAVIARLADRP